MKYLIYLFLVFPFCLYSQPNCNVFLYSGDTLLYNACVESEKANQYYQFQREFYEILDRSIAICPYFAYAYREKSVAYLKSGDFLTWKKIIDKAVEYDMRDNLGYRGWCRFQFFRDYDGAIKDIEKLDSLVKYDIGYSVNGDYHLNIAKGICYSALNEKQKAIEIFHKQLDSEDYQPGRYDYYQLGVTYCEIGEYENALTAFNKQSQINELAENTYYICKIYKILGRYEEYRKYKDIALKLFDEDRRMSDPYTHHYNSVHRQMIDNE